MLYEAVKELVCEVYPVKSIDGVTISKSIRKNCEHVLGNITEITVVLYSVDIEK